MIEKIISEKLIKGEKNAIIIGGPTCSGKSSLALDLTESFDSEIVSADSMQIYKGMDIGTAKESKEVRAEIPHHMIDIIEPWENYSAYNYKEDALKSISDIISRGKIPIICGGTGLYINSLLDNRDFGENVNDNFEDSEIFKMNPFTAYTELQKKDPEAAATLHPNNEKRVKRMLYLYDTTGKTREERNIESKVNKGDINYILCLIMPDRDKLYAKIDQRVDLMLKSGLRNEFKDVYEACLREKGEEALKLTSLAAIGYKEFIPYYDNISSPLVDEIVRDQIKLNTRHYAKRQYTWFKRTATEFSGIVLEDI